MKTNLYNEDVDITSDLDVVLKKCFVNHLLVYNQTLSCLHDDNEMSFKNLKKEITKYITERQLTPIIEVALLNEIYYQYKKFKRNVKVQKLITDIQYFTFLCKGYSTRSLMMAENQMTVTFDGFPGEIRLKKPLPVINEDCTMYVNLSFSNIENNYKISIYRSQ